MDTVQLTASLSRVEAREGIVDRNNEGDLDSIRILVEAREGLVDRNPESSYIEPISRSRPARASWIEIFATSQT